MENDFVDTWHTWDSIIQSWLILFMLNKLFMHLSVYIIMACSLVIMEYVVFGFWRWHLYCGIASHCIAWHLELCREPMVATVPVQHRHNDAASYLVGYEGRSSYACICIHHHLLGADTTSHLNRCEGRSSCALIYNSECFGCGMWWSYLVPIYNRMLFIGFRTYRMWTSCHSHICYVWIFEILAW